MNLYLISQDYNEDYDTFDSAVVAAYDEEGARNTSPCPVSWNEYFSLHAWCDPIHVNVKFLCSGYEGERGVVLASFNAG